MIEVPSEGATMHCITNTKKPLYWLRRFVNYFLPSKWKRQLYVAIKGTITNVAVDNTVTFTGFTTETAFDVNADTMVTGSFIPGKENKP